MTIILDNGHGSNTPGKCSPVWPDGSQLFEYEFNRDIVRRIKEVLTDTDIRVLVPEKWDVSLATRVDRANAITRDSGAKNTLLISIHANAGGGTGWEVWTSPGNTRSDVFASNMFVEIEKLLSGFPMRKDMSDGDPDKEANFYILKYTICPAILTENLFMDRETDCRFIMSEAGRKLIAQAHVNFIKRII
jgi:N-acetylmuramoyl-L-alanine amidase